VIQTYGVIALARTTFDMEFAEEMKDRAFAALDAAGIATVGPRTLACDTEQAEAALAEIAEQGNIDLLLIVQITFTDASMTIEMARHSDVPVAIWGVPEPRIGGRLRLNAYCGINLAAHALGKAGLDYRWLFSSPDAPDIAERLRGLAEAPRGSAVAAERVQQQSNTAADRVVEKLGQARVSVIGEHPAGFDTCEYDANELHKLTGISVDQVKLDDAFERAKAAPAARANAHRAESAKSLAGLDDVDQEQLDRSFRLLCALEDIVDENNADSIAVRCWPETFVEYGCAACGPMAMMNQAGVPSACEADVYGSVTTLMLQELAGEPVWMADLVDVDEDDNTAVLWHCGLAPLSMCDPEAQAEATIHTNRKMPLLHQFPLKPGRVTLARLSQAKNEKKLMIAGAEVLRAPMAFTGTSGVIRFDKAVAEVCTMIMGEGLEHHFALAYGDHLDSLRQIASRLDLPVLQIA
jgi:L-fucose isomerase-like protein